MAADFRAPVIPNGVQETGCKKQGKGDKCHGNVDSATLSSVRKDHAAYISSTIFPSVPRCNAVFQQTELYFRARIIRAFFDRFNENRAGNQDR